MARVRIKVTATDGGACDGCRSMTRAVDGVQIGVVSLLACNCQNPYGSISTFTSVSHNLPCIRSIMNGQVGNVQNGGITMQISMPPSTTRRPLNFFQGFFPSISTI